MRTIEEQLQAILDSGCPLSELLGRLADMCEEQDDCEPTLVAAIRQCAETAESVAA